MAIPTFATEIAFGSKWSDDTYTWTDVTDQVGTISFQRGRQQELDRIEAGTGASDLLDDVSNFSPSNTSGLYYPNVKVLVPIRQTATIGGTTYGLMQHFVEELPRDREGGYAHRQITTVDAFDFFALAGLAGFSRSAELSGTRIGAVLDHIGWASGRRVISTGTVTVPACDFAADDDTKALTHMLDIADAEAGIFFINGDGNPDFVDFKDLLGSPFNASQATFSDQPASDEVLIVSSTPNASKDLIFNQWSGTRDGGVTQSDSDADSIDDYGPRSQQLTPLLSSDAQVLTLMQRRLTVYKDPLERIESITVAPGEDTAAWEAVLPLDVGSRITVIDHPPGGGDPTTVDYTIQNISFPRNPGSDAGCQITYELWPADVNAWMVLDDATYGLLDSNKLA